MLKLLVFDLDGTLADTRRDLAESVNHALARAAKPILPLEKVMESVGNGAEALVTRCLAASLGAPPGPVVVKAVLAGFLEHYGENCTRHTAAYPGLTQALNRLRGRRMAVLTNKPGAPTRRILDALGLSGYFDLILGGDTAFGRKPDAGGLRHVMAALEAAPADTAMIGDGVQDAGAARGAGTRLIAFLGGIAPREAILAERPDASFAAMDELPAVVAALESRPAPRAAEERWR